MTTLVARRTAVTLLVLFVSPWSLAASGADTPAATGNLWEVTSQMSMAGMPMGMPAQKLKVCSAKEWTQPPAGGQDQGCTTSDFVRDGNRVTWKTVCEEPMAMTGTGEIIFDGDDAYSGEIRYASEEGDMVMKLNGHRVGDCDHPQ